MDEGDSGISKGTYLVKFPLIFVSGGNYRWDSYENADTRPAAAQINRAPDCSQNRLSGGIAEKRLSGDSGGSDKRHSGSHIANRKSF